MKVFGWLFGLALVAAACSSASTPVAEPTVAAESPGPTATVEAETETPTPEPIAVSDEDRIAAALAQLEADVAAGEVEDVVAFDVLSERVNDDTVTFTICAWAGDSAFDVVRDSVVATNVEDDGTIEAQHITSSVTTGECLNTELIDSAFAFIDEYDAAEAEWSRDPASFANDPRAGELLYSAAQERLAQVFDDLIADNVYFEPATPTGDARAVAVADIFIRRFQAGSQPVLELVVCREMAENYGKYRDGVLIDAFLPGDVGPHSAVSYELVRTPQGDGWLLFGDQGLNWGNCSIPDLQASIQDWLGDDEQFEVLAG